MFTGLVEKLARVLSVSQLDTTASGGGGFSIVIGDCSKILEDVALGDSICCNGSWKGNGKGTREFGNFRWSETSDEYAHSSLN